MSLLLANLVVLFASGAHAVVPFRLAEARRPGAGAAAPETARARRLRAWRIVGPLLLLSGAVALLWIVHRDPDGALAAGIDALPGRSLPALLATAALLLPAAGHLAALLTRGRTADGEKGKDQTGDDRAAGKVEAAVGAVALIALAAVLVSLRLGAPEPDAGTLRAASIALTALLGLAAGELAVAERPAWSALAGGAILLDPFLLSSGLRGELIAGLGVVTLGAGALLLLAARWLPAPFRRPSLAAGLILVGLYLERVRQLAAPYVQLHGGMELLG